MLQTDLGQIPDRNADHSASAKGTLLKLGVMWVILGVGGTAAGYLMGDGHVQVGLLIGFGNLMLCLGLGIAVLTELSERWNELRNESEVQQRDRVLRSPTDVMIGITLFLSVTAIMAPFVQSAANVGFQNISKPEQTAIVVVGLGLVAALGSLFLERR